MSSYIFCSGSDALVQPETLARDALEQWKLAQLNVAISKAIRRNPKTKKMISGTSMLLEKEEMEDVSTACVCLQID